MPVLSAPWDERWPGCSKLPYELKAGPRPKKGGGRI